MDPPPPWTYAGRAAYFGDRVCRFCDHHNPAAAKFCNDCGSPLHLRPCKQCDAVNDQAATSCYQCGAEFPTLSTTPEATSQLPAGDPALPSTSEHVGAAASVTRPTLPSDWRSFMPGRFVLAAIALILIAGAYAVYCINVTTPVAIGVAPQAIDAGEHSAPAAASAVPLAVESKPVETETAAAFTPSPATTPAAPKSAHSRERQAPVPATKRASAHQRPLPESQASIKAAPSVPQTPAAARVGAPVAQTRKEPKRDPWQAMHASLAHCNGDLIDRIVCDQRVRRRFCAGHWGETPECASVVNDRGQ